MVCLCTSDAMNVTFIVCLCTSDVINLTFMVCLCTSDSINVTFMVCLCTSDVINRTFMVCLYTSRHEKKKSRFTFSVITLYVWQSLSDHRRSIGPAGPGPRGRVGKGAKAL